MQRFVATSFSPDRETGGRISAGPCHRPGSVGVYVEGAPACSRSYERDFLKWDHKFSPDGRWLAYVSDESGEYEVYVRPYPGPGGNSGVRAEGESTSLWSRDGKELFYRTGQKWMSAAVTLGPEFTAEKPRLLFEGPYLMTGGPVVRREPGRPAFSRARAHRAGHCPVTHLNVVLNWFEELRQKTSPASAPR